MGYFENTTEADVYMQRFCLTCQYLSDDGSCPILTLHERYGYTECINPVSILGKAIPMDEFGINGQCTLYQQKESEEPAG